MYEHSKFVSCLNIVNFNIKVCNYENVVNCTTLSCFHTLSRNICVVDFFFKDVFVSVAKKHSNFPLMSNLYTFTHVTGN